MYYKTIQMVWKFPIEGDNFRLGVRQYNCPSVDNSIVSCLTGNCAEIDPDITNRKLICRLLVGLKNVKRRKIWSAFRCRNGKNDVRQERREHEKGNTSGYSKPERIYV